MSIIASPDEISPVASPIYSPVIQTSSGPGRSRLLICVLNGIPQPVPQQNVRPSRSRPGFHVVRTERGRHMIPNTHISFSVNEQESVSAVPVYQTPTIPAPKYRATGFNPDLKSTANYNDSFSTGNIDAGYGGYGTGYGGTGTGYGAGTGYGGAGTAYGGAGTGYGGAGAIGAGFGANIRY